MDGHPGRVCIEYFEWMVEERDIIPREIHGYSLWPHMLFSPRVHTVRGGGKREAEEEKKYQEREREREREGSKHEGAEGWSGSKVFYSLNIGPNQTPSAPVRARI